MVRPTASPALLLLVVHVGGALGCSLSTVNDGVRGVTAVCCGSSTGDACGASFPARCEPECAALLLPFWDECADTMQLVGDTLPFDLQGMTDFAALCAHTGALFDGATSCAAGSSTSGSLETWAGEVNAACCEQGGVAECDGASKVPSSCDAECASAFLPFAEECLGLPDPAPPPAAAAFARLYQTCMEMNTRAPDEVAALLDTVNALVANPRCTIDTSSIVSAGVSNTFGGDGGHHRRRRQLQALLFPAATQQLLSQTRCPLTDFTSRATAVSDACCAAGDCPSGLPEQCTFGCARQYDAFASDCSGTETVFFLHLLCKMISLPRQARDQPRVNSF